MRFAHIVSLGGTCTPAFQARAFTGDDTAFPFDWLITPFTSMVQAIESDFDRFFDPATAVLRDDRKAVLGTVIDLIHLHDFPHVGEIIADDWRDHAETVAEKFRYLVDRWRRTMAAGDPVLFIRHQGHFVDGVEVGPLTVEEADGLCTLFERRYPGLDFRILFANALHADPTHPRAVRTDVPWVKEGEWADPADNWKGSIPAWHAALSAVAGAPVDDQATSPDRG